MRFLPILWLLLASAAAQKTLVMRSLDIVSGIRMRFATTKVRAVVENIGFRSEEYHFVGYLPAQAFVSNFTMEVDNYQSIAILKERSQADDLFKVALDTGATAATTSADANVFTTRVSIGAGKTISFELTYEEVLTRAHGVYKHVINIQPNLEVELVRARVRIVERGRIDREKLRVPQFGYALAAQNNAQLLAAPQEAGVRVKSSITDNVSIIDISISPPQNAGQLVVLYDVEREHDAGYLEVVNGYFVHFFAPPKTAEMQSGSQNIVFLLDASYSMCGRRWDSVKKAIREVLGSLSETDFFNIVTMNFNVHVWELASVPVTKSKVEEAMSYLSRVGHRGGSNMFEGLRVGLDLLRIDEATPMISSLVLITDGYPSQGVLDSRLIVKEVTSLNKARKMAIHTLALGREADHRLLSKLANYNRGISRRIYEDASEDVSEQIAGFFRELSSPLMRDVKIKYLDEQVDMSSLVTQQGPAARTYWDGGEILVAGRLKASVHKTMGVEVEGVNMAGDSISLSSGGNVRRLEPDNTGGFLERIWAYLQIRDLLRSAESTVSGRKRASHQRKALALAKQYNFVTDLTALLVIPLELQGSADRSPISRGRSIFAPDGATKLTEERSPVVKIVKEVPAARRSLDGSRLPVSEVVAGAPTEENVVAVDKIRAELGPGSDLAGNPSSQTGILEHNAIAIDPLSNVDLRTLISIANPDKARSVDGIWRNSYVGPETAWLQGYARLLPSLDPATRHAAASLRTLARNCHPGAKMDIIMAFDVSESLETPFGGPASGFLLRSIAQRLIAALTYAPQNTRVGIVLFAPTADKAEPLYTLDANQNPNALINILAKTGASSIQTDEYYNAFNLAYDMFLKDGREEAEKVLVMLSANDAFGRHRTISESMRQRGVRILAIAPHQKNDAHLAQLGFVTGSSSLVFTKPILRDILSPFCNNFLPPRT